MEKLQIKRLSHIYEYKKIMRKNAIMKKKKIQKLFYIL